LLDLLSRHSGKEGNPPSALVRILVEGERNDGLFRYGCAMRRKGWALDEIEPELLKYNTRNCNPPLHEIEVRKITERAASYPIGGPDPLQKAWQATEGEIYPTRRARFLGLCRHLQDARSDQAIALPIKRIGELMGVHWTTVSLYRKAAVKSGVLIPAGEYVPHKLAGRYRMIGKAGRTIPDILTRPHSLTKPLSSGLVRECPSENCLSENAASEKAASENFPSENVGAEDGYLEILL
jgi:hypothetical protein